MEPEPDTTPDAGPAEPPTVVQLPPKRYGLVPLLDPGTDELRAALVALLAVFVIVLVAVIALLIGSEDAVLATGVASVATGALTVIGTITGLFGGHRLGAAGREASDAARLQSEQLRAREQSARMRETIRSYAVENRLSEADRAAALAEADELANRLGIADSSE